MRFKPEVCLYDVAGEQILMLQGQEGVAMTKVMALNATSLYLWHSLHEKSAFVLSDVTTLLTNRYEVDATVAQTDAQHWVDTLKQHGLIVE